MATKKKIAKKEIPANATLENLELEASTRSYQIFAYFEDGKTGEGVDFELKVGKQTDLGKLIGLMIDKMKSHPNRKVR